MDFVSKRRKAWPYAQNSPKNSIGKWLGTLPLSSRFRVDCWDAVGDARREFTEHIKGRILSYLEQNDDKIRDSDKIIDFSLFMIGSSVLRAKPTIMLVSEDKKARKEAFKMIKDSDIMKEYPGFELAHIPLTAEFENLKFLVAVLPSDDNGYFAASSLRRSHSSATLVGTSSAFTYTSHLSDPYKALSKVCPMSDASSVPSSPCTIHSESTDLSCASTAFTNLTTDSQYDNPLGLSDASEDHFMFPSFAQEKRYMHPEIYPDDNLTAPQSHKTGDSYTVSPANHDESLDIFSLRDNQLGYRRLYFYTISGSKEVPQTATAGGVIAYQGKRMFLTVNHFLERTQTIVAQSSLSDSEQAEYSDDECEITGLSDFDEDDEDGFIEATSRGSITPESEASNVDGSESSNGSISISSPGRTIDHQPNVVALQARLERLEQNQESISPVGTSKDQCIRVGKVILRSKELDYSLIEVDPAALTSLNNFRDNTIELDDVSQIEPGPRDAAVKTITSDGGIVEGTLSGTPSYARLPHSKTFMEVYIARFSKPLVPGDCGSWVRDAVTGCLFGHVFAGSPTSGLAMVMPACYVIEDARHSLELQLSSSYDSSNKTLIPGSPDLTEHAKDDSAVSSRPSRQVDYLSHDWKEEDIWSSWRYIVTRRGEFANSARLENASWRAWMRAKNNLKTVSPETLNWLKECDVTWLYGPLQSSAKPLSNTQPEQSNFYKRPILKKRSMSEVMLQRSLSNASLLKQATAAVQAQGTSGLLRPRSKRETIDYFAYPLRSRKIGRESSGLAPSAESSGITSPNNERKHIHFNEQVEQCIAIVKGDDDETDINTDGYSDSSDSDDGVMTRHVRIKKRPILKNRVSKSKSTKGKIIAMLPSTALKYREDTPEPKEILRPSKLSGKFFFDDDDDEEHSLEDTLLSPALGGRSTSSTNGSSDRLRRSVSTSSLDDAPGGMRRTSSGMLMPYEEGDPNNGEGIFDRVIDTANTAHDIAHAIWNVGWRK